MTDFLEKMYGRVVAVNRQTYGSILTVAASIADTVLTVASTDDFDDEDGGQVVIGGEVYAYVEVDEEALTVTLDTGLLEAAPVDTFVELYDPEVNGVVVEYVADVLLDDQDPGDEPIEVTVQHGLVNLLAESVRGGAAESVVLVRDGDDDWVIWQIDGKLAVDVVIEELKGGYEGTLQDIYDSADAAAEAAADAAANATTAMTAANGKNKVTVSLSSPGSTPNAAGDIWFRKESSTQTVIEQWEGQGGTSWNQVTLNNQVIANLDAGKIVAGSAFTNALSVKTNFTLGDTSTNGVIQSYNFAGSSVGVYIDKFGLVAKGGSLTGALVTGSTVQTDYSGQRVVMQPVGSMGAACYFYGPGGSSAGAIYGGTAGLAFFTSTAAFAGAIDAAGSVSAGGKLYVGTRSSTTAAPNLRVGAGGEIFEASTSLGPADSGGTGYRLVRVPNS